MITAGVDLATQPAKTGLAVIEWRPREAQLTRLQMGATDQDVVEVARAADKVGIDCPLGWPDDFIAFITAHAAGRVELPGGENGDELRRRLAYRETDRALRRAGYSPLSVAADRIGLTAMRAAVILEHLATAGVPVDRSGAGVVAEVYPAASLKRWGLPHRQYKREENRRARQDLVAELRRQVPWLDFGEFTPLCEHSDDALDAVIAALTARAAALGRCELPPDREVPRARREGWILLPNEALSTLMSTSVPGLVKERDDAADEVLDDGSVAAVKGDEARVVAQFSTWLGESGWQVDTEVDFCDVVATRGEQILYAEAKGRTAAPGLDVDTMYGQLLRRMLSRTGQDHADGAGARAQRQRVRYAVVVPSSARIRALRVPESVRAALDIDVYVVSDDGAVEAVLAPEA